MMKKSTEIEIKTDNIYCPECGDIQSSKNSFCSHCGANLHKKTEEVLKETIGKDNDQNLDFDKEDTEKRKNKKPFWKNKIFLFFLSIFVIAFFTLATVLYLKSNEENQFKTKVKGIWEEVYKESDSLNKEVLEMNEMDDFAKVGLKLKNLEKTIDNKQDELNKLKTPENFKDGKEALLLALSDYKVYLQDLRSAADSPQKMTDQDIEEIENLAETSKTSFIRAFSKLNFLEKKLSDDTFTIVSKFEETRNNYEEKLASEEQAKAEEERKKQQEAENKAKVESIVTSFMNAYIAGNEGELKKYMTLAFQKEFNYADLSSDARMYSYPESFRITLTKKTSDTLYDVYGRELQVNRESGSKWTINRHFAVIWVQSENKWLIDRWDISSE